MFRRRHSVVHWQVPRRGFVTRDDGFDVVFVDGYDLWVRGKLGDSVRRRCESFPLVVGVSTLKVHNLIKDRTGT